MTGSIAPLLSVIIPSHRPAFLRDLLRALLNQSLERKHYEIIAVCDYSIAPLRQEFPDVTFLHLNDSSISRKRNAGVRIAKGDIIAFIDDDCLPAEDWLASGLDYCTQHGEASALEGRTSVERGERSFPALREYARLETFGMRTNNLFCRKEAFINVGGFDERFTLQREDLDFCFTMLDNNYTIHRCDRCNVVHRLRPSEPWDLLKNCRNRRFDPLLYKKHPSRYREHVGSPFPPTLQLLLALHLIAGLAPLLGIVPLLIGIGLDLLTISFLAARRARTLMPFTIFMIEWISYGAAPFVLLGALVQGSIRFRKLLIV